nr:hypothetical protein CFP56_12135 [Quercus suber]
MLNIKKHLGGGTAYWVEKLDHMSIRHCQAGRALRHVCTAGSRNGHRVCRYLRLRSAAADFRRSTYITAGNCGFNVDLLGTAAISCPASPSRWTLTLRFCRFSIVYKAVSGDILRREGSLWISLIYELDADEMRRCAHICLWLIITVRLCMLGYVGCCLGAGDPPLSLFMVETTSRENPRPNPARGAQIAQLLRRDQNPGAGVCSHVMRPNQHC